MSKSVTFAVPVALVFALTACGGSHRGAAFAPTGPSDLPPGTDSPDIQPKKDASLPSTIPAYPEGSADEKPLAILFDTSRDCRVDSAGHMRCPKVNAKLVRKVESYALKKRPSDTLKQFALVKFGCVNTSTDGGFEVLFSTDRNRHPGLNYSELVPVEMDNYFEVSAPDSLQVASCRLVVLAQGSYGIPRDLDVKYPGERSVAGQQAILKNLISEQVVVKALIDDTRRLYSGTRKQLLDEAVAYNEALAAKIDGLKAITYESVEFSALTKSPGSAVKCGAIELSRDLFAGPRCTLTINWTPAYLGYQVESALFETAANDPTFAADIGAEGGTVSFRTDSARLGTGVRGTMRLVLGRTDQPKKKLEVSQEMTSIALEELSKGLQPLRPSSYIYRQISVFDPSFLTTLRKTGDTLWVRSNEAVLFDMPFALPVGVNLRLDDRLENIDYTIDDPQLADCLSLWTTIAYDDHGKEVLSIAGQGTLRFAVTPFFSQKEPCRTRLEALRQAGRGVAGTIAVHSQLFGSISVPSATKLSLGDAKSLSITGTDVKVSAPNGMLSSITIKNSSPLPWIGYPMMAVTLTCKDADVAGENAQLVLESHARDDVRGARERIAAGEELTLDVEAAAKGAAARLGAGQHCARPWTVLEVYMMEGASFSGGRYDVELTGIYKFSDRILRIPPM